MYNVPSYVNIKEFFCKNMRIPSILQIVEQKMSHNEKLRKSFWYQLCNQRAITNKNNSIKLFMTKLMFTGFEEFNC